MKCMSQSRLQTCVIVMLAVLSAASAARTLYGLPLLIPLALLAAVGLESIPRWLAWPLHVTAVAGAARIQP